MRGQAVYWSMRFRCFYGLSVFNLLKLLSFRWLTYYCNVGVHGPSVSKWILHPINQSNTFESVYNCLHMMSWWNKGYSQCWLFASECLERVILACGNSALDLSPVELNRSGMLMLTDCANIMRIMIPITSHFQQFICALTKHVHIS